MPKSLQQGIYMEGTKMFSVRQIAPCLFSLLVAAGASGCSPASASGNSYVNKEPGFSIDIPASWEVKEGLMGSVVAALSPPEGPSDNFRENVNVVTEKLPWNLSQTKYLNENLKNMRRLLSSFTTVEQGVESIGGEETAWMVYTHRMGTFRLKAVAYFLTKASKGYVITCTAAPRSYPGHESTFKEIARSFRFE